VAEDRHSADVRRRYGKAAEALAALYLEARGLETLARNVRCKGGEIDLVCRDGEVLVMVEVRQRSRHDFGGPLASVTRHKQRKIMRAARFVLQSRPAWRHRCVRFDVIGLQGELDNAPQIVWIRDAFRAR